MHLFYDPTLIKGTTTHTLNEEESKHACKVMRLKEDDSLIILNGKGQEFNAIIVDAHNKHCKIKIIEEKEEIKPKEEIHIALAPTKMMDRLEWFLEKATEIGITEISLILCDNSERKVIKIERLEKILISAMKQSKRLFLPKLNNLIPFKEFISNNKNGLIAHCYDKEKSTIKDEFRLNNCPIIIGPEGDFSLDEVKTAIHNGYKTISLGDNRLRTETAALYCVMQSKLILEAHK